MLVTAVMGGPAYGRLEEGSPCGGVHRVFGRCPHCCQLSLHLLPPLIQSAGKMHNVVNKMICCHMHRYINWGPDQKENSTQHVVVAFDRTQLFIPILVLVHAVACMSVCVLLHRREGLPNCLQLLQWLTLYRLKALTCLTH